MTNNVLLKDATDVDMNHNQTELIDTFLDNSLRIVGDDVDDILLVDVLEAKPLEAAVSKTIKIYQN